MKKVTLGSTGITVDQNAFGALPVQRVSMDEAVTLLRTAYEGGMRFFDTAHAYSDSEKKLGEALSIYPRESYYLATKTAAKTLEVFRQELAQSLEMLRTDYIDIYQLHCAPQCFRPGDGTGLYEAMLEAKAQGKIRHIGITAHLLSVANEIAESGLYETLQFPFSYLADPKDIALAKKCAAYNMGFIAMKGLAGGLIRNANAAMAFISQYNVLPIWGIQRMSELEEWLRFFKEAPNMDAETAAFIEAEKKELVGDFCRGCGYCMPCPKGIIINQGARMSLMLRRAPSAAWLNDYWQAEMAKIDTCIECYCCAKRCPYSLDTPKLLKKNLEDYRKVLAGEVKVQ